MKVNYSDVQEDYQKFNAKISELEDQLSAAESVLVGLGYRRCDCPACNCGSCHKPIEDKQQ